MTEKRKRRPTGPLGGAFLDFMAVFDPGTQHVVTERERQRREVVAPGDSDKDWDVDLDGGVARRVAAETAAAASDGTPGARRR